MHLISLPEANSLPGAPAFLCSYLGLLNDGETYSANSDIPNYCQKTRPAAPVSLDHQILTCTTADYLNCPIYMAAQARGLPPEWSNLNAVELSRPGLWRRLLGLIGIHPGWLFLTVTIGR